MTFEALLALIVLALAGLSGLRRARDSERIVVFRFGRPQRLAGPGLAWIAPLRMERGVRIDMDAAIPYWRSLPEAELVKKAFEYVKAP